MTPYVNINKKKKIVQTYKITNVGEKENHTYNVSNMNKILSSL